MGILGLSLGSKLGSGAVPRNGETSRNGWTAIGEWQICWLVSSSELDSARCFSLPLLDSASDAESDSISSFPDLDGGSLSPSWLWMLSLRSLRYGLLEVLSCSNSCHHP